MKISRELKKEEALRRLKSIDIFKGVVEDFKEDDYVYISYPPYGALYWIDDSDKKRIMEFEEHFNAFVYLVIKSNTEFGELNSYLFVSDHEEEWEEDREMLKHNESFVYVDNLAHVEFSEFGTIGFETTIAKGLVRIW